MADYTYNAIADHQRLDGSCDRPIIGLPVARRYQMYIKSPSAIQAKPTMRPKWCVYTTTNQVVAVASPPRSALIGISL